MSAGRPSKFTPEIADKIVSMIAAGHYLTEVAPSLGLSVSGVKLWLRRGKRTGKDDQPYRDFLTRYQVAKAERIISLEKSARSLAKMDGVMALKMLEKLSPRYSSDRNLLKQMRKDLEEIKAALSSKQAPS